MATLKITERTGHFNLINPSQESCSMHFAFENGDEKKYLNLSFSEERGYSGFASAEDAAWIIDEWDRSMFISTRRKDAQEFKEFVLTKADEIEKGNLEATKQELIRQKDKIEKKLAALPN